MDKKQYFTCVGLSYKRGKENQVKCFFYCTWSDRKFWFWTSI